MNQKEAVRHLENKLSFADDVVIMPRASGYIRVYQGDCITSVVIRDLIPGLVSVGGDEWGILSALVDPELMGE